MKSIHRELVLLLTMIMLLTVACPAAAMAEMGVSEVPDTAASEETGTETVEVSVETVGTATGTPDTTAGTPDTTVGTSDTTVVTIETLANTAETTPVVEELEEPYSSGDEQIPSQEKPAVEAVENQPVDEVSVKPVVEEVSKDPAVQASENTESAAEASKTDEDAPVAPGGQPKQENVAGIEAANGTAAKAAGDPVSNGSVSAADGSAKIGAPLKNAELFISARGSDESGDGSFEAPFASISAALNAARGMGVDADLCLLSNLSINEMIQIVGINVYLTSNEGAFTVTRGDAFNPGEGGLTSMFAVGSPDPGNGTGGQLILEHVILDEKGVKTEPLQDAMITVYNGGKLIIGEEAMLLNYGGQCAVHGCMGSEITIAPTAWILDNMAIPADGTVAIQADEGCSLGKEVGCIVLSHGETWEPEETGEKVEAASIDGTVKTAESAKSADNVKADEKVEENETTEENKATDENKAAEEYKTAVNNNDLNSNGEDNAEVPVKADANSVSKNSVNPENDKDPSEEPEKKEAVDSSSGDDPQTVLQKKSILAGSNASMAASSLAAGDSTIGFTLDAPDSVSSSDDLATIHSYISGDVAGYPIPYTLALDMGSFFGSAGGIAGEALSGVTVHLTFTLDELNVLYPETKAAGSMDVKLMPAFHVMKVKSAVYGNDRTIALELSTDGVENWKNSLDELKGKLNLSLLTVVLADGSYPQKSEVTSSAKVDEISFMRGERDTRTLTPSGVQDSARTKLLGKKTATLTYDPNEEDGGSGGPGTESLPAEEGHALETSNVPAHTDLDGYPVVFLGWTEKLDRKVYSDKDTAPATMKTVDLGIGDKITVYAVYSYDRNADGIPDVNQRLLTLGFEANGGTGAPEQMIKAALSEIGASFDIPEKEPTRKYYTFLGWSKDEDATEADYKYDAPKKVDRDITIVRDTCLYAVWQENPIYTLYFNGNGGSNVPPAQSARSDNGVASLTITRQIPTRSGRSFVGWSTQRYGSAMFAPGEDVRLTGGDVTLYAVWERNGSSSGSAPKTGDESHVALYATLAIGSAAVLLGLALVSKKRRK